MGRRRGFRDSPQGFLANLGDFLKNLTQKGVGVRPCAPSSGSAPDYPVI